MPPVEQAGVKLFVFFGLIASGKSTLAEAFALDRGMLYLNTDRVRKELAGIRLSNRQAEGFNQGIYTSEFTRRTYQEMLDRAAVELESGRSGVVLDGSYGNVSERSLVCELARRYDLRYCFVLCRCSDQVVRERLALRAQDPHAVSDGRWEIYLEQKEHFQPPAELESSRLVTLDTDQSVDLLVKKLAEECDLR